MYLWTLMSYAEFYLEYEKGKNKKGFNIVSESNGNTDFELDPVLNQT